MSSEIMARFLFHQMESKILLSKLFGIQQIKQLILMESSALTGFPMDSYMSLCHLFWRTYSPILIGLYTLFRMIWAIIIALLGLRAKLPALKNLSFIIAPLKLLVDLEKYKKEKQMATEFELQVPLATDQLSLTNLSVFHMKNLYYHSLTSNHKISKLEESMGLIHQSSYTPSYDPSYDLDAASVCSANYSFTTRTIESRSGSRRKKSTLV